jgi:hypothetical protein
MKARRFKKLRMVYEQRAAKKTIDKLVRALSCGYHSAFSNTFVVENLDLSELNVTYYKNKNSGKINE